MKFSYNVALVAGSRPSGVKQFSSTAEAKHNRECRDWLKAKFAGSVKADLAGLGSLNLRLTEQEAADLELDPRILYVEQAVQLKPAYFQENVNWGLSRACGRTDDRFKYSNTGNGVAIYIVDSGVSETHSDLEGRVTDLYSSEITSLQSTHGTNVASIAAGTTLGVAKRADIFSVRVGDTVFESTDVIAGLNAIITHHTTGPAVVNMSFSSPTFIQGMADAIASLIAEDVICIAAAGNDTILASLSYPANYTDVICVGAIQEDLDIASFSNYGPRVDILAPGRFVLAASMSGGTEETSGTSVAAPYVAGAAACAIEGLSATAQADFKLNMLGQAQLNLSTHTEGTTTKNVILTDMVRVWLGNTGSISGLTAVKKYTLKPFTEDIGGGNKIYETEQTVVPVQRLATLKRLGANVTNQFAIALNSTTVSPGDNPSMLGSTGGTGIGGDSPRHIVLSLDPDTLLNLSLNLTENSGTASFTLTTKPVFEVKEYIELQGLVARVERIGPNYTQGEKSYKIECRIIPEFGQEYVSVNYPNMADGDSHSVHMMIEDVATQAGTTVTVSVADLQIQDFTGSGRFAEVLASLASRICGNLVQQNGAWFIVPKDYILGDFTVPAEDIKSVTQSYEGDILDTISGLAEDLKSAYIEADELADKIEDLEEDLDDLKDQTEDEEVSEEDGYRDARVAMDDINILFGLLGDGHRQPIDPSIIVESVHWDYWDAPPGSTVNETTQAKYFQVTDERDHYGEYTGRMKGLKELTGATLYVPFTKPSNSSGIYFARGSAVNLFGAPIVDKTWDYLYWVERKEKVVDRETSKVAYVVKHYFVFSPSEEGWHGGISVANLVHKAVLNVEYVPTVTVKWKFAGTLDFSKWVVTNGDQPIGMVNVDGEFFNINGELVTEITNVNELPGPVEGLAILSQEGGLAAWMEGDSFWSVYGEHCGVLGAGSTSVIKLGNNTLGRVCGWIDGVWGYYAFPGLGGALPQEDNPVLNPPTGEETIDRRPLPIYFMTEIPSAEGVDYSTYDPANPDLWVPSDIDPSEEEVERDKEIKARELEIAELKIDAAVLAAKIACIIKELTMYGVEYLVPTIKEAADAWTAHRREKERQDEGSSPNLTLLRTKHAAAVAKDQALMQAVSTCPAAVLKTDCTFIYNNVLPMPNNELTVPFLPGNISEEYETTAGVIDSVSLSASSGDCLVSISSIRYKE